MPPLTPTTPVIQQEKLNNSDIMAWWSRLRAHRQRPPAPSADPDVEGARGGGGQTRATDAQPTTAMPQKISNPVLAYLLGRPTAQHAATAAASTAGQEGGSRGSVDQARTAPQQPQPQPRSQAGAGVSGSGDSAGLAVREAAQDYGGGGGGGGGNKGGGGGGKLAGLFGRGAPLSPPRPPAPPEPFRRSLSALPVVIDGPASIDKPSVAGLAATGPEGFIVLLFLLLAVCLASAGAVVLGKRRVRTVVSALGRGAAAANACPGSVAAASVGVAVVDDNASAGDDGSGGVTLASGDEAAPGVTPGSGGAGAAAVAPGNGDGAAADGATAELGAELARVAALVAAMQVKPPVHCARARASVATVSFRQLDRRALNPPPPPPLPLPLTFLPLLLLSTISEQQTPLARARAGRAAGGARQRGGSRGGGGSGRAGRTCGAAGGQGRGGGAPGGVGSRPRAPTSERSSGRGGGGVGGGVGGNNAVNGGGGGGGGG